MSAHAAGIVEESQYTLEALDDHLKPLEERISSPAALRNIHEQFKHNDEESSANRAAVQELVDFVPPYDPAELESRGQGDRFNVNFGLVTSIVNEAVGSYLDIFTTPTTLLNLALESNVASEEKEQWAAIMSEEFAEMVRSWDASTPLVLLLDNVLVTHGVGIPWFEDSNNLAFEVGSMEDFHFDDDAVAISSKIEATTVERSMSVAKLYSKVDGKEVDSDGYTSEGWNVEAVKELIARAQPSDNHQDEWSYEKFQRTIKGNRVTGGKNLPNIELIWGFIRELDGTYSVYAAANNWKQKVFDGQEKHGEEPWIFRARHRYKDANQAFQIFTFGVGNKLNIHTVRGLAYYLYEAGQADNVIRCKGLDAARLRASEVYQVTGGVESELDMQMVDIGHAFIIPQSLRGVQQQGGQPLDRTIGVVLENLQNVMDRHSGGLASSQGLLNNPAARRNELQVAAELDHLSKLLSFAINLYYPPYEKLLKEMARRAFTETQTDLETIEMVKDMKRRIIERGVPKEMFHKIDYRRSKVSKIMGAGSRGTRMLTFSQLSQLFPEMDPQGQEYFSFDWATEMVGHDRAIRYFGRPGQRRGHYDVAIARLENARMSEGDYIEPEDGENRMVHLRTHIEEGLEPQLQGVDEGMVDIADFSLNNVTLFQHVVATLEVTTVHESMMPHLNALRQRTQQIGEIIENGIKAVNAQRRRDGEQPMSPGQQGQDPSQQGQEMSEGDQKRDKAMAEIEIMVAKAQATLEQMAKQTEAKIEQMQRESMAKIALQDKEVAAKIKQARALEAAKAKI